MECKWCGEQCDGDYCSENCRINDMEACTDPEERLKLQDAFDHWLDQQEKEMEGRH